MKKKENRYRTEKAGLRDRVGFPVKVVLGLVGAVFVVLLFSAGLAHSYHALVGASWLAVKEIEIQGLKRIDRDEALNTLGVPRDESILNLKLTRLAKRLETIPQLRSAVVRLDFPGRIVVEVTEREPLAVVQADELLFLDEEGKLFARANPETAKGLLLVTGFAGSNLKAGDPLPAEPFDSLLELVEAMGKAGEWLSWYPMDECRWEASGFVLVARHKSIPIRIGNDDFDEKLNRLRRVFELLAERRWLDQTTRIDLDYSNRVYIGGSFPGLAGSKGT